MATKKTSKKDPIVLKRKKIKKVTQSKKGKTADKKRKAMPAGVRLSKSGKVYTERRSNRAD